MRTSWARDKSLASRGGLRDGLAEYGLLTEFKSILRS